MTSPTATIPKGSLVLVTGATGYVAGHVILNLLQRGYRVRGTVRDIEQASWLKDDLFPTYSQSGAFEIVEVPDLAPLGAFDEAVKGTSGVVHIATVANMSPNPYEVIPQTVQGALNAIESAAKEPGVKSFVYTSSVVAFAFAPPGKKVHVDSNSWSDLKEMAYAPAPYQPERAFFVYIQSKAEAEKAVWKFVDDNNPTFSVNAVHPGTVEGEVLHPRQWNLTPNWIKTLWNGDVESIKGFAACKYTEGWV